MNLYNRTLRTGYIARSILSVYYATFYYIKGIKYILSGTFIYKSTNPGSRNSRPVFAFNLYVGTVLTVLLLFSILQFGYTQSSGGQPGAFLGWGAGARSLALGKAFIAIADDSTATYWNPAAAVQNERKEISALHAFLWEDTSYDFITYVHPTPKFGIFGFNYTRLYSGGFGVYEFDWNTYDLIKVREFADEQIAFTLTYGRRMIEQLSIGVATKLITRSLDISRDFHFAVDTYLFLERLNGFPLRLGFAVQSLLSMKFGDTDDLIPIGFRLGGAYKLLKDKLMVAVDFDKGWKSNINWHLGTEYWVLNFAALRLGFEGDFVTGVRESTAGFGIRYKDYGIDYAFAFHQMGASHRISGSWRFGSSVTVTRQEEVNRLVQEGLEAYRQGNYTMALGRLNTVLDIDPTNKDAQRYSTKLQVIAPLIPSISEKTKESEVARNAISSFVEGDAKSAVNGMRYAYSMQQSDERMLKLLNKFETDAGEKSTEPPAVATKPTSDLPQINLVEQKLYKALQNIYNRQYDLAAQECQDVINLEPTNIVAYERLGSAFFLMNEKEKARAVWLKVLEIDPNNKVVPKFLEQLK